MVLVSCSIYRSKPVIEADNSTYVGLASPTTCRDRPPALNRITGSVTGLYTERDLHTPYVRINQHAHYWQYAIRANRENKYNVFAIIFIVTVN